MIQKGTVTAMTLRYGRISAFPAQVSNEITARTDPLTGTLAAVRLVFAAWLIAVPSAS
jgi:hypothetical protein